MRLCEPFVINQKLVVICQVPEATVMAENALKTASIARLNAWQTKAVSKQEFVSLAFTHWRALKERLGLESNTELACSLYDR